MPGWNECGIYDEACRKRTCDHPTNPKNQGVQCRTMLSQRPCGSSQCTREECSGARKSAEVFMSAPNMCDACGVSQGSREWCEYCGLDTTPGTKNGSTGSESVPQTEGDTEPTYTLQGLSARDVERIEQSLRMLRRTFTRDSEGYREISELGARVSDCKWSD